MVEHLGNIGSTLKGVNIISMILSSKKTKYIFTYKLEGVITPEKGLAHTSNHLDLKFILLVIIDFEQICSFTY